jgi:hypothetical protein
MKAQKASHKAIAIFACGAGEGVEPSIQGLASSMVMHSQYATLFTTMALLESMGRVIGTPFMAFILRVGRDNQGEPNGLVFIVASVSRPQHMKHML